MVPIKIPTIIMVLSDAVEWQVVNYNFQKLDLAKTIFPGLLGLH